MKDKTITSLIVIITTFALHLTGRVFSNPANQEPMMRRESILDTGATILPHPSDGSSMERLQDPDDSVNTRFTSDEDKESHQTQFDGDQLQGQTFDFDESRLEDPDFHVSRLGDSDFDVSRPPDSELDLQLQDASKDEIHQSRGSSSGLPQHSEITKNEGWTNNYRADRKGSQARRTVRGFVQSPQTRKDYSSRAKELQDFAGDIIQEETSSAGSKTLDVPTSQRRALKTKYDGMKTGQGVREQDVNQQYGSNKNSTHILSGSYLGSILSSNAEKTVNISDTIDSSNVEKPIPVSFLPSRVPVEHKDGVVVDGLSTSGNKDAEDFRNDFGVKQNLLDVKTFARFQGSLLTPRSTPDLSDHSEFMKIQRENKKYHEYPTNPSVVSVGNMIRRRDMSPVMEENQRLRKTVASSSDSILQLEPLLLVPMQDFLGEMSRGRNDGTIQPGVKDVLLVQVSLSGAPVRQDKWNGENEQAKTIVSINQNNNDTIGNNDDKSHISGNSRSNDEDKNTEIIESNNSNDHDDDDNNNSNVNNDNNNNNNVNNNNNNNSNVNDNNNNNNNDNNNNNNNNNDNPFTRNSRTRFASPLSFFTAQEEAYKRHKVLKLSRFFRKRNRAACDLRHVTTRMLMEFLRTGKMCGHHVVRVRFGIGG